MAWRPTPQFTQRAPVLLTFLLLAAPALAGCVNGVDLAATDAGAGDAVPPWVAIGAPVVQDHDHSDAAAHAGAHNMALVGYNNGYNGEAIPEGVAFTEVAIHGDYAYLCRVGAEGGFIVFDVSDRSNPVAVGEMPGEGCFDVKVSADGDTVFYATQRNPPQALADAGADPSDDLPRGLYVVDVTDKTAPAFESFFPMPPNGVHTITPYQLGDRQLLTLQTYDLASNPMTGDLAGAAPFTQKVVIGEIVDQGGRQVFETLSVYQRNDLAPAGKLFMPHDTYIEEHPLTGDVLMYVAYWDLGVRVVDITDPENPREVGAMTDFAPSMYASIHLAAPHAGLIDGRHVTITEPELVTAEETGQFTIYDTTDPTKPEKLGHWAMPGDLVITEPFQFSPHNFNAADGRVTLAHNHGGVWVVDISTAENLTAPKTVGYYFPSMERPGWTGDVPRVWSAFNVDGHVFASDSGTGLYILEFTGA